MLTLIRTGIRLAVRVQPRAARTRVVGCQGGMLKVQVSAPPIGGAANAAVVDTLAAWLGVPRRTVRLVRGMSGRDKVVEIAAADPTTLVARIQALGGSVDSPGGG